MSSPFLVRDRSRRGDLASLVCLLGDDQKAEMGVCAAVSWLYWPARAHGVSPLSG